MLTSGGGGVGDRRTAGVGGPDLVVEVPVPVV